SLSRSEAWPGICAASLAVATRSGSGRPFAESPRGPRRHGFLYRSDRDVPGAVLLLCHRARTAQDSALQCDTTSYGGMDCAAIARGISGTLPLSVRNPGPGPKVRPRCAGILDGSWPRGEAYERAVALAKWAGGALDRELPAGDHGSRDCMERGASQANPAR